MANKEGGCSNDVLVFRSIDPKQYSPKYIFNILSSDLFFDYVMAGKQGVKMPRGDKEQIIQFPIPAAPIVIQKKIVAESNVVDKKVENANSEIAKAKAKEEIESLFQITYKTATQIFKLSSNDFKVSIGKRLLQKEVSEDTSLTQIYSANVFEVFGYIKKDILKDFSLPSVIWGIDGDWMVNYIPENNPFYPTDHCGVLRIFTKDLHSRYVAFVLDEKGKEARFSRTIRASIDRIKGISIEAPDIKIQNEFATKIEKLEEKIKQAKKIIEKAPQHKQQILDKYLK
jgi:restriction endonuclease S subunit